MQRKIKMATEEHGQVEVLSDPAVSAEQILECKYASLLDVPGRSLLGVGPKYLPHARRTPSLGSIDEMRCRAARDVNSLAAGNVAGRGREG